MIYSSFWHRLKPEGQHPHYLLHKHGKIQETSNDRSFPMEVSIGSDFHSKQFSKRLNFTISEQAWEWNEMRVLSCAKSRPRKFKIKRRQFCDKCLSRLWKGEFVFHLFVINGNNFAIDISWEITGKLLLVPVKSCWTIQPLDYTLVAEIMPTTVAFTWKESDSGFGAIYLFDFIIFVIGAAGLPWIVAHWSFSVEV